MLLVSVEMMVAPVLLDEMVLRDPKESVEREEVLDLL